MPNTRSNRPSTLRKRATGLCRTEIKTFRSFLKSLVTPFVVYSSSSWDRFLGCTFLPTAVRYSLRDPGGYIQVFPGQPFPCSVGSTSVLSSPLPCSKPPVPCTLCRKPSLIPPAIENPSRLPTWNTANLMWSLYSPSCLYKSLVSLP